MALERTGSLNRVMRLKNSYQQVVSHQELMQLAAMLCMCATQHAGAPEGVRALQPCNHRISQIECNPAHKALRPTVVLA